MLDLSPHRLRPAKDLMREGAAAWRHGVLLFCAISREENFPVPSGGNLQTPVLAGDLFKVHFLNELPMRRELSSSVELSGVRIENVVH